MCEQGAMNKSVCVSGRGGESSERAETKGGLFAASGGRQQGSEKRRSSPGSVWMCAEQAGSV